MLFSAGAGVAILNAYLSFLRYPLHRLRGRSPDTYRHASGFPMVGTLLLVLGWLLMPSSPWAHISLVLFLVADTGGPLWFVALTIYAWITESDAKESCTVDSEQNVECCTHGRAHATYVCKHLLEGASTAWYSGEPEPDGAWPDAWCDQCHVHYEAEGEWNEASETAADLSSTIK